MPKYRFELLQGNHAYNAGNDVKHDLVKFRQGDIIETDLELDKMFNAPGCTKFRRLQQDVPDTEEALDKLEQELAARRAKLKAKAAASDKPEIKDTDDLASKGYNELLSLARANGIIGPKEQPKREDLENKIRQALQPA